jgi:hypothetical protein
MTIKPNKQNLPNEAYRPSPFAPSCQSLQYYSVARDTTGWSTDSSNTFLECEINAQTPMLQ